MTIMGRLIRQSFFVVATETFFERPAQKKANHSELFEEITKYYQVNPAEWI